MSLLANLPSSESESSTLKSRLAQSLYEGETLQTQCWRGLDGADNSDCRIHNILGEILGMSVSEQGCSAAQITMF